MAIDRAKESEGPDIEEILDDLTSRIERLRVLYEQYFMGIEKMEPHTLRRDVTRKLLDLTQIYIRNTAQRYRFNMLNQKFSVYTTYWNRTLRSIENGTYYRDVARAGRSAARKGVDVPDEVLKALPKRLRDKILKDRERMAKTQARADEQNARRTAASSPLGAGPTAADEADDLEFPQDEGDGDIDAAFDSLFGEAEAAIAAPRPAEITPPTVPPASARPAPARPAAPPPRAAAGSAVPPARPAAPAAGPVVPPARPAVAAAGSTVPPPGSPVRATGTPLPRPAQPPGTRPPVTPPPGMRPPGAAPPSRAMPPSVDEGAAQDLFKKFVQAKKLLGENTDNIKLEHIVDTIAKQTPVIMKQHQAKGVDFQVVIKDDKVILKATPKK